MSETVSIFPKHFLDAIKIDKCLRLCVNRFTAVH